MSCMIMSAAKRSLLLACAFVALTCCILVPGTCSADDGKEQAFLDAQMLVDGWEASYCYIDSLKVRFTRILLDEKGQNPIPRQHVPFLQIERIQDGSKFLVRSTHSPQGFDDTDDYSVNSFDGSIGREYWSDVSGRGRGDGTIYRGLRGRSSEAMNLLGEFLESVPDLSSKPTSQEEPQWKVKLKKRYPKGIPVFIKWYNIALEAEGVKVRPYLESVAGESCHVLELSYYGTSRTIWLAHEKGMLPMKRKLVSQSGKVATKEAKEIVSVTTDTGILWYPRVIMGGVIRGRNYSYTTKVTVDEFVPYFKAPAETFSYVFPNETRVWDQIEDLQYRIGPSELETEMTKEELDILESGPAASETIPVSLEKDNESEGPEDRHTDVAQEQSVRASGNDESQKTKNYVMLCLFCIVVAASAVFLMMRGVLSRKKTTEESNES